MLLEWRIDHLFTEQTGYERMKTLPGTERGQQSTGDCSVQGSGCSAVSELYVLCNNTFMYLWTAPMKGARTTTKWALFWSLKNNPYHLMTAFPKGIRGSSTSIILQDSPESPRLNLDTWWFSLNLCKVYFWLLGFWGYFSWFFYQSWHF